MQTQNTFSLGTIPKSAAPTLPAPLDNSEYQNREQIRAHQNATQAYFDYQREIEYQIKVAADLAHAKEVAEANRPQSDEEYDAQKRIEWQAAKDKNAARLKKEIDDELAKTAYLLSSPPVAEVFARSEFAALKAVIQWAGRGYTMPDEGFHSFSHGFFHIQMTAPAAKKAPK